MNDDILIDKQNGMQLITFNRVATNNAFDDSFLANLGLLIEDAQHDNSIRVIIIKANGKNFSAGADISWMQRMISYSENDNQQDALILAHTMHSIYASTKPVIAMVHGCAYAGGAGIVAACDTAFAATNAIFCFSEARLGLIPAVISPYIIEAIGQRAAKTLFMSAETFDAKRGYELGLIHKYVDEEHLLSTTIKYAEEIAYLDSTTVKDCKNLVRQVSGKHINAHLQKMTASIIAKKRVSPEAQKGLKAFLNKEKPTWN